jgi:hypothetical protein
VLNHSVRLGAFLAVFALFAACNTAPSAPTAPTSQPVRPTTGPGPSGQPVQGARVFVYASARHSVAAYTLASRFVLYDNGTFALQYASGSLTPEYRGTYTETDGQVMFTWEGWSVAGPWGATGVLTRDSLAVTYNFIMIMSDFEDATYTLIH